MNLKILYLHQYFNTPDMSGGTRSYELARRLVAKGHRVELISADRTQKHPGKNRWRVTNEEGIIVHWCSVPYSNNMGFASRIKAFLTFALSATARANSIKADIVFATSTPLTIALPGIAKHWLSRIPMVFEVRDLWPELPIAIGIIRNPILKFFARALEKLAYKNSEAVVALSPGMRDGIVATGYDESRVSVIPNACDREAFVVDNDEIESFRKKRTWLGDKPLVLYAGTLGEINGVGYLVEVAKHLMEIDPSVRILIVGEGKERDQISAQAEVAGVLGKNLFLEDYLPKNEMATLFGAADISVSLFVDLPEMQANSANKFFDTLAAGRPIMINYGGWQADIIEESGAGFVTWKMPHAAVAESIAKYISDKDWLETASGASYRLACQLFDREKLSEDFELVLQNAVLRQGDKIRQNKNFSR